jgi:GntR family transcriptional regulator, transcriptional repressor for pyruvate dehydrogenase complex
MGNCVHGILYSNPTTGGLWAGKSEEMPMYKMVRTSRLYEQIVQQIEESIREGRLKPGEQLLAERELAQQFGVSRTAVREAVKTLSEKGLVEAYSGRGTFVTSVKSHSMRHSLDSFMKSNDLQNPSYVAEVREILEPEFTALAATRIEEQQLAMMREAVAVMDRSMKRPDAYIEADLDFHLALAEAAGNPLILSLLDSIVGVLREQRMNIFTVAGGPERGQAHHKVILEAIEQHNSLKARNAMRAHLKQIRTDSAAAETHQTRPRKGRPS